LYRIAKAGISLRAERMIRMAFRERMGCFLLAAGGAVALLYAVPLWSALQKDPQALPLDWLGVFGIALLVVWLGWKLFSAGRRAAPSLRRPSLAERAWNHWHADDSENNSQEES
jgi:threonine/homoserine/homoserine lactone efflux protein